MSKGDPHNLFWEADNPEIGTFRNYLHSMEEFLQAERQKHTESIDSVIEKHRLEEINISVDTGKLPTELEYDYYQLEGIDLSANILWKSSFISLYALLETNLMKRCRQLERQSKTSLSVSDIAGRGIGQAMTYLIKVQHLDLSLNTSAEWNEIQNYRRLRNCIVHNNGILDEGTEQRRQIEEYIRRHRNLSLSLGYISEIILDKDFCTEALETIARFLQAIDAAIARVK